MQLTLLRHLGRKWRAEFIFPLACLLWFPFISWQFCLLFIYYCQKSPAVYTGPLFCSNNRLSEMRGYRGIKNPSHESITAGTYCLLIKNGITNFSNAAQSWCQFVGQPKRLIHYGFLREFLMGFNIPIWLCAIML